MKKLKIAFVLNEFPTLSETFILDQITYLIDQGHQLSIYSRAKGNCLQVHPQVGAYHLIEKTVYVPTVPKSFIKRLSTIINILFQKRDIIFFVEILRCINLFKIGRPALTLYAAYNFAFVHGIKNNDVIHAHFGPSGLWMALYKKVGLLKNLKLIVSFHGFDILPKENKINNVRYQNLFRYVEYCTVNSPYSYKLLNETPIDKKKIIVLPVGLDTKKFQPLKKTDKHYIEILFCGRLINWKAPDMSIKIIHELIKEGVNNIFLIIIGEGPERNRLTSIIRNYNLMNKVKLVGAKTQQDVIAYYQNADVFLFPGIHDPLNGRCETQGLVVQEAQAMEIPVVVSDVGGIKYGMLDGVTGFVVNEGDTRGFVEVLKKLIFNSELRSNMGKEGRKLVLKYYNKELLGNKLEKIYYKALDI